MHPFLCRLLAATAAFACLSATAYAQVSACKPATVTAPPRGKDGAAPKLIDVPANPAHCGVGLTLKPDPGVTLWRCHVDDAPGAEPADPWTDAMLVMRDGKPAQVFRDDAMVGQLQNMQVIRADLDGDGKAERILALWNAQSLGMGVNSWTIYAFTADWTLIRQFDNVKDWGRRSIVAAPAGRAGCDIAITDYVDSLNARGQAGISLEARFHRLRGLAFEPASDRPALRRRYTNAFQKARDATFETSDPDEGDIAGWMSDRSATPAP